MCEVPGSCTYITIPGRIQWTFGCSKVQSMPVPAPVDSIQVVHASTRCEYSMFSDVFQGCTMHVQYCYEDPQLYVGLLYEPGDQQGSETWINPAISKLEYSNVQSFYSNVL